MRILVTDGLDPEALASLQRRSTVDVIEAAPDQLASLIPSYDALIVRSRTKVTAAVIERGSRLKVIARAGVGVDNIDLEAATKRGIPVVNAPAASTTAVAELTIGHMLSLARHLAAADRSIKEGKWEKARFEGTELGGKTLGLIGSGRIGAEVAKRARAFGMRVIAHDPYLPPDAARERGIELTDLATVLRTSDFVSIHAALTPETRGMVGPHELGMMRRTAYLVDCARGEIVREDALAEALRAGTIAGAAIDVFAKEPPSGSPLLGAPNVVFTPHLGASTREAQASAGAVVVDQVERVLDGKRPEFVANPDVYV